MQLADETEGPINRANGRASTVGITGVGPVARMHARRR
jgi:hypothetical protein